MTPGDTSDLPMDEHRLTTPVGAEDLGRLKIGDVVFLTGLVFTGRNGLYRKLFEEKAAPPVDIPSLTNVTFHCSPAAVQREDGSYVVRAVTATASFRFEKHVPMLMDQYGVRLVIGKGGMSPEVYEKHFKRLGAVFLNTVGYGIGAQYGRGVKGVREVHWLEELGIAQAVWVLDCENMGPFIVESDLAGNSLFELSNAEVNKGLPALYRGLPQPVLRRFGETIDREEDLL